MLIHAACDSTVMHRSGDDGLQSPSVGSPGTEKGQYKFHFNIGSIDSFDRKMEEAQEDLGWATDSFVPITYTNELSWQQVGLCLAWVSSGIYLRPGMPALNMSTMPSLPESSRSHPLMLLLIARHQIVCALCPFLP